MSIQTTRNLSQLKKQCDELNLTVIQSGKRESKTDYILALREYFLKENYSNGIPKSLELILQIESPMLCNRFSVLNESEREEIWNSPNWILEQKEDGARMMPVFTDGKWDFYSRNISVTDFLPVSYQDHFYLGNVDFSQMKYNFILDGEIVSSNPNINTIMGKKGVITESQLQAVTALMSMNIEDSLSIQKDEDCPLEFHVFDILWLDGEWLIDKPLKERIKYLVPVIEELQKMGMKIRRPYSNYLNKKRFYSAMISSGNEGCVAKNLNSPYVASNSRRRDGFVKIKRSMSETAQMQGLGDTIDAFVTGFEPADENKSWAGLVGAIEFSVFLDNGNGGEPVQHKIARITNVPMELREQMTEKDSDGNIQMKKEWYGKVASVDGQCISSRSKRLKHAVLVDWRPDRDLSTCLMSQEFLNSMIL